MQSLLPALAWAIFVTGLATGGAQAHPPALERTRFLMGTTCRIQAHVPGEDPAAIEGALDAIARLEDELSTWRADSPLSRFNGAAGGAPSPVAPSLLRFLVDCRTWSERTQGAFDPVVGALVDAWDLRGTGRRPSAPELRQARARSGMRLLEIDVATASARLTHAGAWLDSGGIAKGLALDVAARELRARGISDALLDFGGQVLVLGTPAEADAWTVAIADPTARERPALVLDLTQGSVSTSAQSERGVVVNGQLLGHVLDPRTGRPVDTQASVTALAPNGQDADALSTALLVMGPDVGLRWIRKHSGLGFEAGYLIPRSEGGLDLRASPGFFRVLRLHADGVTLLP